MDVNATNAGEVARVTKALLAEFAPGEVKIKPAMVKNNRALALHYIDARLVMDRLDLVVGVNNWKDEYTVLPGGNEVECRLSLRIAGEWVTKADVGGQSEQPDEGDRMKAAYSDALKRAAVKFGVGRFLYRMPQQWMDYDPVKKQIVRPPVAPKAAAKTAAPALPSDGRELHNRLRDYDAKLAARKVCRVGELLSHVARQGAEAGYGDDIASWSGPAIPFAVDAVKQFEATAKQPA